jgi:hypothetical protein
VQTTRYEYGGRSRGLSGENRPEAASLGGALKDIGARSFQSDAFSLPRMQ